MYKFSALLIILAMMGMTGMLGEVMTGNYQDYWIKNNMTHSRQSIVDPYILLRKPIFLRHAYGGFGLRTRWPRGFSGAMTVGELGLVYAVDVLKDVLENIRKRAAMENLLNVQTVWADLERSRQNQYPGKNLDVAFLINVLFQSKDKPAILDEALRLLKDKARLVVVDWARDSLPFAPPKDKLVDFDEIKVARGKGWLRKKNFQQDRIIGDYLLNRRDVQFLFLIYNL